MRDNDVKLDPSRAGETDDHDDGVLGTLRGMFDEAVGTIPIVEPIDPGKPSVFEPVPDLDPGAAPSAGAGGAEGSGAASNAAGPPAPGMQPPESRAHHTTGVDYHSETGALSESHGRPLSLGDLADAVNTVNPLYAIALGANKIDQGIASGDSHSIGAGIVDVGLGVHGVSVAAHAVGSEGASATVDDARTTTAKPNVSVQELAEPRIRDAHLPGADLTASKSQGVDAIAGTNKMVEDWRQGWHDGKPLVVHEVDGGVWGQIKCMEKADVGNFKRNVETAMEKFDDRLKSPEGPRTRDAGGETYLQEVFKNPEGFRLVVEVAKLTEEQRVQLQAVADEKAAGFAPLLGAPVNIVVVDAHAAVESSFHQSPTVVPGVDDSRPPVVPVASGDHDPDGHPAVEHSFVQSQTTVPSADQHADVTGSDGDPGGP